MKIRKNIFLIFLIMFFTQTFSVDYFCWGAQDQNIVKVVENLSLDSKTGAVSYTLNIAAKVRIRVGAKDGPLLRTIVDWQEREAGSHKEEWNGFDGSGKLKLVGREDLVFTFNYFTKGDELLQNVQIEDIMPSPEKAIIGRHLPNLKLNQLHKEHSRNFCKEPKVDIALAKNISADIEGNWIVEDKTPLTVSVAEQDKQWFNRERFSIHIFIDGIFVEGILEGYSPYNWMLDPKYLNQGKHIISFNLSGFNDHIGIISIPIYVRNLRGKDGQAQ